MVVRRFLQGILVGLFAGILVMALCVSGSMWLRMDMPEQVVYFNVLFLGGLAAALYVRRHGWILGVVVAVFWFVFIYVVVVRIGSQRGGELWLPEIRLLGWQIGLLWAGPVGGLAGDWLVRLRRRRRRA